MLFVAVACSPRPAIKNTVRLATAASVQSAKKPPSINRLFEAYVRHLMVYGSQITVAIDDPKPCPIAGFRQVTRARLRRAGQTGLIFYVSKDGQKIVQGSVYDVKDNPFKEDLDKLKTDLQPSWEAGAPVVLVEFSDFQCTYCKQEAQVLRTNLASAYPKQVRLYFVDRPLEQIASLGDGRGHRRPLHLQAESQRVLGLSRLDFRASGRRSRWKT